MIDHSLHTPSRSERDVKPTGAHRPDRPDAPFDAGPAVAVADNQQIQAELRRGAVQPKLAISPPDDPLEREADEVADAVVQRKEACSCGGTCEECQQREQIQLKRNATHAHRDSQMSASPRLMSRLGSGRGLDPTTRGFFEANLNHDFGRTRIHTDAAAAESAASINARAYTHGRDVVFGRGEYAPHSTEGRRLIAHELTHVVQQNPESLVPRLARKPAPDRIATGRVVSVTENRSHGIQRLELPSWDDVVSGAEELYDEAVETGEQALDWAEEKAEQASEAAGEAADWLLTTAGQAALDAANGLAGLYGGSVVVSGGCLIITIPSIPLFPSVQKTLTETPPLPLYIPIIPPAPIGPLPLVGTFGVLGWAQASIEAAVGPGEVRGISFTICPFSGPYIATAQLYVAAAIAPRITLFAGLAGAVGGVLPTTPPIPIWGSIEGGLRGTGTGWIIGAVQDTVTITYAGGTLSFSNITDFMAGVLLTGDVDLFAALRLMDKIICQYVYPLGHWEVGRAWKLTIPIHASLGGGGASGSVGPITHGPIPISDIQTAIGPLPAGWNCLSWAEVKKFLCDNGILPPEMCEENGEEEPGALKTVTASGRCKCVGDDDCGGGKIYVVCYTTQKDCKRAQKDLDNFCNNNSEMKKKCVRPKCYYRHSSAKCPDKCEPGTITPLKEPPTTAACPTQTVTMSGAQCGTKYGALGKYCYSGAANWWFKEKVKNGPAPLCQPGPLATTTIPFQSPSGCVNDGIFNFNGPPADVAPCKHPTAQTVFAGPTEADVEKCQYKNAQLIVVTVKKGSKPKSGKVITSSAGVSTDCDWP